MSGGRTSAAFSGDTTTYPAAIATVRTRGRAWLRRRFGCAVQLDSLKPLRSNSSKRGSGMCSAMKPEAASAISHCDLTGAEADSLETLTACVASSERTLVVRLGEREAHIGPRLIRGLTVCCSVVAMHPHPVGSPSPLPAELWLGLAAQRAFVDVSGVSAVAETGCSMWSGLMTMAAIFRTRGSRLACLGAAGVRFPASRGASTIATTACVAASRGHVDFAPRRFGAQGSSGPLSRVEDIELSTAPGTVVRSSTTIGLPPSPGDALEAAVAWTSPRPPESARRLSIGALSALLTRVAGQTGEGAARRRIAPTGGNLGLVRVWALAREIDGLERGAYWYDGGEHSLVRYGAFDDANLRVALGTEASLPPCVLLGAGEVAKCAQKYQGFAYRLVHFDAGIAVAFAFAVAEGLGLSVREYADFDVQLPAIFGVGRRWEYPLPDVRAGNLRRPDTRRAARHEQSADRSSGLDCSSGGYLIPHRAGGVVYARPAGPDVMDGPSSGGNASAAAADDGTARRRAACATCDTAIFHGPAEPHPEAIVTVASAACAGRADSRRASHSVRPVLMVQPARKRSPLARTNSVPTRQVAWFGVRRMTQGWRASTAINSGLRHHR